MLPQVPKIARVGDEMERNFDKFGEKHHKVLINDISYRFSLINHGFDIEELSLKTQDIPTDIAILVIADPKVKFDQVA